MRIIQAISFFLWIGALCEMLFITAKTSKTVMRIGESFRHTTLLWYGTLESGRRRQLRR
jgi:hypothetical protein